MVETLLAHYYRPYHQNLKRYIKDIVAGIDCHTMAAFGPPVGPESGVERPAACLSNAEGTCPDAWLVSLAGIMVKKLKGHWFLNHWIRGTAYSAIKPVPPRLP